MAATILYDSVTKRQLAVDSTVPNILLNEARLNMRLATASGTILADTSYPTGGYGPLNSFGLKTVAGVFFEDVNGYGVYYNKATDKVQFFSTAGTEVAAATNLSALPAIYFEAKGLA